MGCDIHGAVEVKSPYSNSYDYVIDISSIVNRDYDAFGLLFGVRNYGNFESIAEHRGLPNNISYQLKDKLEGWGCEHSTTYITLDEIRRIDYETESLELDDRIHQYKVNNDGILQSHSKFSASSDISNEDIEKMRNGETIEKNGYCYKMEKLKIKDVLGKQWQILFKMMEVLTEQGHKPENIRMVVFFDN